MSFSAVVLRISISLLFLPAALVVAEEVTVSCLGYRGHGRMWWRIRTRLKERNTYVRVPGLIMPWVFDRETRSDSRCTSPSMEALQEERNISMYYQRNGVRRAVALVVGGVTGGLIVSELPRILVSSISWLQRG